MTGSLRSESSWSLGVGESLDLTLALLKNFKEKNGKVWSTDAASDGLSLSLTSSSWSVQSSFYKINSINLHS